MKKILFLFHWIKLYFIFCILDHHYHSNTFKFNWFFWCLLLFRIFDFCIYFHIPFVVYYVTKKNSKCRKKTIVSTTTISMKEIQIRKIFQSNKVVRHSFVQLWSIYRSFFLSLSLSLILSFSIFGVTEKKFRFKIKFTTTTTKTWVLVVISNISNLHYNITIFVIQVHGLSTTNNDYYSHYSFWIVFQIIYPFKYKWWWWCWCLYYQINHHHHHIIIIFTYIQYRN